MVSDEKLWIIGYPKYLLYFKVHMIKNTSRSVSTTSNQEE